MHETEDPENWNTYVAKWMSDHGLAGNFAMMTEGPSPKYPEANHRMVIIDLLPGSKKG